jgi:TPP-dependent indolepyruvate ferredoxin oxidoreductase alpha subunit
MPRKNTPNQVLRSGKEALAHGARKAGLSVAGDIGCYTLTCPSPLSALPSCLCMGAGVTFNEGWREGTPGKRIVGVFGDYLKKLIPYIYHNCPEWS